ncbi:MAG: nuclear transport factor 2 family protein, partial [Cyanobacteria bacterium P01_A01_bin.17]
MRKHWTNILVSAAIATGAVAVIPTTISDFGALAIPGQTAAAKDEETTIRQLTQQWFELWSPGKDPMDWEAMGQLFAQDPGELLVFDDAGGKVVVLQSWKDYRTTWEPFMEQFTDWQVKPEGEIRVIVEGDLATTMFTLAGGGIDQEGNAVEFRQRG